jgi:glutathione S-transferase
MILYGISVSPFARKVLMFAAEKGIALENLPVRPHAEDPDFRSASPFGKIPAFRDGDFTLADSTAIVTYLEAKFPSPPLLPAGPPARAKAIWFEELADTVMFAAGTKLFFNRVVAPKMLNQPGDQARADEAEAREIPPIFAYLESVLPASGFLVGDALTIADIAVVNQLVNLEHSACLVDTARYPKLAAYYARHKARPSIAATIAAERALLGL